MGETGELPAITIPADITLENAQTLLNRYSINSVPVEASAASRKTGDPYLNIVGIITRQVIEKSVHHDLGNLQVGEYMSTDIDFLSLNATLSDIQELIIENRVALSERKSISVDMYSPTCRFPRSW